MPMDTSVLYATDALFIVAVVAPPSLVIIYRIKDVRLRGDEVGKMMKAAFENPDEAARRAAREALDNNPYVSEPKKAVDHCHKPWRYILPLLMLITLAVSSAYVTY